LEQKKKGTAGHRLEGKIEVDAEYPKMGPGGSDVNLFWKGLGGEKYENRSWGKIGFSPTSWKERKSVEKGLKKAWDLAQEGQLSDLRILKRVK